MIPCRSAYFFVTLMLGVMPSLWASASSDEVERADPSSKGLVVQSVTAEELIAQIAEQSGDAALFMKDQGEAFATLSLKDLDAFVKNAYFQDTLKPFSNHLRHYRGEDLRPEEYRYDRTNGIPWGKFDFYEMNLRLVSLSFEGITNIGSLNLNDNPDLRVLPSLTSLQNLTFLSARSCGLIVTPKIDGLTKLRRILLGGNQFTEAPNIRGFNQLWILNLPYMVRDQSGAIHQCLRDIRDYQESNNMNPEYRLTVTPKIFDF